MVRELQGLRETPVQGAVVVPLAPWKMKESSLPCAFSVFHSSSPYNPPYSPYNPPYSPPHKPPYSPPHTP